MKSPIQKGLVSFLMQSIIPQEQFISFLFGGKMGADAKSNWRKMRQKNTLGRVGEFYQCLVANLLDCTITEQGNTEYADMYNETLGIRVEVKARDNNHAFGISVDQKRVYEKEPPFPLNDTLYALVTFRNSKRRGTSDKRPRGVQSDTFSELARLNRKSQQQEFLAGKVDEVFLLDLEIISALERTHGTRVGHFAGRAGEDSIVLRRTELREYFRNGSFAQGMRAFGLYPSGWVRRSSEVRVTMFLRGAVLTSEFTLVTVLRARLHKQIALVIQDKVLT